MDANEFPLLGEAPAIELANTRYRDGEEVIDFLAPRARGEAWTRLALGAQMRLPGRWPAEANEHLRELRDAVFGVLSACADGTVPAPSAVATVNAFAAQACARAVLDWPANGPSARVEFAGAALAVVGARLATSCIELALGHATRPIRRCEGPGCALLFVQQHGRRRFCDAGCSHRGRQRRYVLGHRDVAS